MDNVDLSGFCLDLLDLCRIDFSVDCPAGCWGEVVAIRVRAPNNRTPACFQSRYNPFLYFCDVEDLRICVLWICGFEGPVVWQCDVGMLSIHSLSTCPPRPPSFLHLLSSLQALSCFRIWYFGLIISLKSVRYL